MGNGKKKILIIDDDKIVLSVIVKVSGQYGAEVVTASDGSDAKEVLESSSQFDLIVCDLLIPHLSGWDIIELIEKSSVHKDSPVIIITGTRISEDEKRKLLKRVNAIAAKEAFTVERFKSLIESCSVLQPKQS